LGLEPALRDRRGWPALAVGARGRDRALRVALVGVGAVQAAILPLAIHQAHAHSGPIGDYITSTSLPRRAIAIPKRFLLGEHGAPAASGVFALLLGTSLVAAAALFLTRLDAPTRRRARPLIAVAVVAAALPLALAGVGVDYFQYRNLLAIWPLVVILVAVALSVTGSRLAALAAGGLACTFLTLTLAVDLNPALQRADWRFASAALGRPRWSRLIVITPNFEADPFRLYVTTARLFDGDRIRVREVDLVGYRISTRRPPPSPVRGFKLDRRIDHQKLSFLRYLAQRPVEIAPARVRGPTADPRAFLKQPGS
jgi:hypothetical protein